MTDYPSFDAYMKERELEMHRDFLERNSQDIGDLECWYINSIDNTVPPIWTREHLEELEHDFWLIAKPLDERGKTGPKQNGTNCND